MSRLLRLLKRYSGIIRVVILLVLFSVLFNKVQPAEIINTFLQARLRYLVLAVFIMILKIILQTARWNYLLGTLEPKPALRTVLISLFGGFFLGAVSPARTGEFARGVWVPGHSRLRIASLTAVEKVFNHFVVLFFGLTALFIVLPWPFRLIPLAAVPGLAAVLLSMHRLKPLWERVLRLFADEETVENALAAFSVLSPNRLFVMLLYSVAVYLAYSTHFYIVMLGFCDVSLSVAIKTLPLIYFIDLLLPISLGDFGVKETASVSLLGYYGISGGAAFGASFTHNVLAFLLPGLAGGIMILVSHYLPGQEAPSSSVRSTPSLDCEHH